MSTKKNLLQEAIADAKQIREAALANAQSILMEHVKENVRAVVNEQLDSRLNENEDCDKDEMKEEYQMTENEDQNLEELPEVAMTGDEEDEFEDTESEEDEEDEDGDEEDLDEGLSEADLDEALAAALVNEVDHGQLGEPELMINGDKNDTGLLDTDSKEEGWDKKEAPKSKAHTLATGEKYHQEASTKIAQLVKENILIKKANKKLKEAVDETKLFNAKLFYAVKLMQKENLAPEAKDKIVERMDKVKSLEEAKNLFESLQYALGLFGEKAKTAKKAKPSLSEALGSNAPVGTGKGVSSRSADDAQKSRFQELAGITRK